MITRVKVCCISSVEEARIATAMGASAIGLVSAMPSGPGVIAEEQITRIADKVPPGVPVFLLTSLQSADAIIEQQRRCRATTLQLVDSVPFEAYPAIRSAVPGIKLVQVIHVNDELSISEAEAAARYADALLLDSGRPKLSVKELGGTGRVHNWKISRVIRDTVDVPIWLAGGLTPGNVAEAIRHVGPFGVDVCSGVRTNGKLDRHKLSSFLESIASVGTENGFVEG